MVVLQTTTAPASRSRAAGGASAAAGSSSAAAVPSGVGSPWVAMLSLTVAGTPSSGPQGAPRSQRASLARAWARAASGRSSQVAARCGSQRAMWSSSACVTSTGERLCAR
jgi:hypothetical protein